MKLNLKFCYRYKYILSGFVIYNNFSYIIKITILSVICLNILGVNMD